MITKPIIIAQVIVTLVTAVPATNVDASALSLSDFESNPEGVCVSLGDEPGMKPVCDWIDVCDDEGNIRPDHKFCTGEAIRDAPGRGGCPEGYHSYDDDESGLCFDNNLGCEYEGMIMRPTNSSCGDIDYVCPNYPELEECTVTRFLGVPDNEDRTNCEFSIPDICIKSFVQGGYMFNGTAIDANRLSCHDVKPHSDFRVTLDDPKRHQFDKDYDGIGCENNDE